MRNLAQRHMKVGEDSLDLVANKITHVRDRSVVKTLSIVRYKQRYLASEHLCVLPISLSSDQFDERSARAGADEFLAHPLFTLRPTRDACVSSS